MDITTVSYTQVPEWNFLHQKTRYFLSEDTDCDISTGLATRLAKYSLDILTDHGFDKCITKAVEVYTTDSSAKKSDRVYCVRFFTAKDGYIEVVGIFTKNGWPFLNHGLDIGIL